MRRKPLSLASKTFMTRELLRTQHDHALFDRAAKVIGAGLDYRCRAGLGGAAAIKGHGVHSSTGDKTG